MRRQLTEDEIERRVEKMTDHLDRLYLRNELSSDDYEKAMTDLANWASVALDNLPRAERQARS